MAQEPVSDNARELVEIYRRADPDFKEIIFSMLTLAQKHGTPFLKETEGPALAGDRKALREIFRKWEAKPEGACT